jgi:acyl dehydratase
MTDQTPTTPHAPQRSTAYKVGSTDWLVLTQEMFSTFEEITLSRDRLHTDPQWVREHTVFDGTIAPGFLTLSLLPYFASQLQIAPPGHHALNYGFERVRWPQPVPVGAQIRAHFVALGTQPLGTDRQGSVARLEVSVEIRGVERPALVAEWLGAILPDSGRA